MSEDHSTMDLESSLEKLEAIVESLESGDAPLQESLEKFEAGLALGKQCRDILDKAEQRVRTLLENGETDEFESTD